VTRDYDSTLPSAPSTPSHLEAIYLFGLLSIPPVSNFQVWTRSLLPEGEGETQKDRTPPLQLFLSFSTFSLSLLPCPLFFWGRCSLSWLLSSSPPFLSGVPQSVDLQRGNSLLWPSLSPIPPPPFRHIQIGRQTAKSLQPNPHLKSGQRNRPPPPVSPSFRQPSSQIETPHKMQRQGPLMAAPILRHNNSKEGGREETEK